MSSATQGLRKFIQRQAEISRIEAELRDMCQALQSRVEEEINRLRRDLEKRLETESTAPEQRLRNLRELQRRSILELLPDGRPRYLYYDGAIWKVSREGEEGVAERQHQVEIDN
jgi:hypothetical protein